MKKNCVYFFNHAKQFRESCIPAIRNYQPTVDTQPAIRNRKQGHAPLFYSVLLYSFDNHHNTTNKYKEKKILFCCWQWHESIVYALDSGLCTLEGPVILSEIMKAEWNWQGVDY